MTNWMQRRKSLFLSITLVCVIVAFIGVGAVSWGSLDVSGKSSQVAKVGNHKISISAFNNSYANYYNYFNNLNNGELTQEMAEQMGLKKIVMDSLINEALLLNLADELGIVVLDEEVINEIIITPNFQNDDGKFDRNLYEKVLRNIGMKPLEYENSLKKQILLNKITSIFNLPISEEEKKAFAAAFFIEDRVSLMTIAVDDDEIKISDNETKTYWENNKNSFLTEKQYVFESIFVPLTNQKISNDELLEHYEKIKYLYKDTEEKILAFEEVKGKVENSLRLEKTKSDSLKTLVSFKKNEINADRNITILQSSNIYDTGKFESLSVGEVIDLEKENGYEILKLTNIIFPQPKMYKEAESEIIDILKSQKRFQLLTQKAESRMSLFEGKDAGYITKQSSSILDLNDQDSAYLIGKIFGTQEKYGYVILNNKAILYKITDQKLPNDTTISKNTLALEQQIKQMRTNEILNNLLKELRSRYKIEQYI